MNKTQNNKQIRNIAVVLAGGVGSRIGAPTPKQFLEVAGKMVIEHTIEAFERHPAIEEIAVVIHPDYIGHMEEIVRRNPWKKVKKVLQGGNERYLSTLSAIKAYEDMSEANLLFHDAVRPLVSQKLIDRVIEALKRHEAVGVAVPATDTIIEVNETGDLITNIPNRNHLRRIQTPQAFRLQVIRRAYQIALQDPTFVCTDDCGTVKRYLPEVPIFVVPGEESNMKLTYKEDLVVLEKLLQTRAAGC